MSMIRKEIVTLMKIKADGPGKLFLLA